jgi:hypothetical protein
MIHGYKVIETQTLPVETTYPASDIATRSKVDIPSGEFIHVLQMQDTLYVSRQVAEDIKKYMFNRIVNP